MAFACRALYPSEMEPVTLSDNCTESSLAILFHGVLTDCAHGAKGEDPATATPADFTTRLANSVRVIIAGVSSRRS